MKKYLLVIIALLNLVVSRAQFITTNHQCSSIGPFILGDSISKFPSLRFESSGNDNGHSHMTYKYSGADALLLKVFDINPNSVLLTFNDSNKLIAISIAKFYYKEKSRKYRKTGGRLYDKLIDEATSHLMAKPETRDSPSNKRYKHYQKAWLDHLLLSNKYTMLFVEYNFAKGHYSELQLYFSYIGKSK